MQMILYYYGVSVLFHLCKRAPKQKLIWTKNFEKPADKLEKQDIYNAYNQSDAFKVIA